MTQITPVALTVFIKNITDTGAFLWMQKRTEKGNLDGLWEFPGGKIEEKEDHAVAAVREVREETGMEDHKPVLFKLYHHDYDDRSVCLFVHLSNELTLPESENQKWFELSYEKPSRPLIGLIPEINHLVIDDVMEYLQKLVHRREVDTIWELSRI